MMQAYEIRRSRMASTAQPVHEFSPRVVWVIFAAVFLVPILATLGVFFMGPGK